MADEAILMIQRYSGTELVEIGRRHNIADKKHDRIRAQLIRIAEMDEMTARARIFYMNHAELKRECKSRDIAPGRRSKAQLRSLLLVRKRQEAVVFSR